VVSLTGKGADDSFSPGRRGTLRKKRGGQLIRGGRREKGLMEVQCELSRGGALVENIFAERKNERRVAFEKGKR